MSLRGYGEIAASGRRLVTVTTALGSQLPGITFFFGLTPPGFRAITLLTSGGTLALFLLVFSRCEKDVKCVRNGVRSISIAVVLAIVYGLFFPYVTVGPPPERDEPVRHQAGFGLSAFSLTDEALRVATERKLKTKEDLMLALGGYGGGPSLIWKGWSIVAAGTLLSAFFVATYVYWTSGLAWLACALKQVRQTKKQTQKNGPGKTKRTN
jgi:hypothetical protein